MIQEESPPAFSPRCCTTSPHKPPKQQSAVTKEATPFLFLFLRLPQVTQAPHCLHRLKCIPDVGAAELLPEMRTALAGWGGIEGLSPEGCLELQQHTPEHSSPLESCLALGMPLTVVSLPKGRAGPSQGTDKAQGAAPQGQGILTLARSSPDMAHHRQPGKKEPSVNQHCDQDLQKGKCQEEVQVVFHHIKIQVSSVLI